MTQDIDIIQAAFSHIMQLDMIYDGVVPDSELRKGFVYKDETISLRGPQGIFKAKQMKDVALSIATTIPKAGKRPIYVDRETEEGFYQYSFEESDKNRNHYLYASFGRSTPFIYFKAVKHAMYQCVWPCFIESINEKERYFEVIVGRKPALLTASSHIPYQKPDSIEARYYVREAKFRGHQAQFREIVLDAYRFRCAITGLPEERLLEAAHIIPDRDDESTQHVTNGISLNRLHHRAFDSNLIGIDPEYRVHISSYLKNLNDGPLLEQGILAFESKQLHLPKDKHKWPNLDYLIRRFEQFSNFQIE